MPRDDRTYITVHDGMPDHPKIEGLSDAAFRLLVATWAWCSRNRTDGSVPTTSWVKRGKASARKELMAAGLAHAVGDRIEMHDYLEHQRSAAEIDELSEKRREAGKKGGKAKALATALAKQNSGKSVADTDTERTRHTSSSNARDQTVTTADPRFVEFWETYPRRVARPEALRAFGPALARASGEAIVKGAQRYRDDPNRDDAFTAHPATWLRRDGWNDPPLPARVNGQQAQAGKPVTPW